MSTKTLINRNDIAWAELRMARAFRTAAQAAHMFGANPNLIGLYREWMRSHALAAVRIARTGKMA